MERMEGRLYSIKKIAQAGPSHFLIQWGDGKCAKYRLSDIQKLCRCANCREEKTGRLLIDLAKLDPDVQAIKIVNVGRYALRVQFTSGCSHGIYPFSLLYSMMDK